MMILARVGLGILTGLFIWGVGYDIYRKGLAPKEIDPDDSCPETIGDTDYN